jgi:hypothetical protein
VTEYVLSVDPGVSTGIALLSFEEDSPAELVEGWKPIVGYESRYTISNWGRVRSFSKYGRPYIKGRKLKGGHHRVALYGSDGVKDFLVHRLVLEAFVGPCPEGMEGLHWDDDKDNNRLSNLRWGTRTENLLDCIRNGNNHQLNKTHCKWGHPFDEANTLIEARSNGRTRRVCKTCRKAKDARIRARSRS